MLRTGNHLRAARALAGLEQTDLAERAGLHVNSIRNMEAAGDGPLGGRVDSHTKVIAALEHAGISFSGDYLRKRTSKRARPGTAGPPGRPAGLETPGMKWEPRKVGWVSQWVCRADRRRAGYPISMRRLWSGEVPSAADWQNMSAQCVTLQREMMEWESTEADRRRIDKQKARRPGPKRAHR
jgi:hypothetical protein